MKMTEEEWLNRTTEVQPDLWAGRIECRQNEWLIKHGFDTVISVMTPEQHAFYEADYPVDKSIKHVLLNYGDSDYISVKDYEDLTKLFGKKTLVHCVSGCNRTTAITLARLIATGMPWKEASDLYYQKRQATLSHNGGDAKVRMSCEMRDSLTNYSFMQQGGGNFPT